MRTKLTVILAATAALALPVVLAAPAAAATLPESDSLWAISCDFDAASLWSIDPANGAGTEVGTGTGIADCGSQGAWNPVTSTAYYINWAEDDNIAIVDLTTGLSTVVGEFTGPDVTDYPTSIAIGLDGAAYAWDRDGNFYSLDLGTGAATLILETEFNDFFSFSVDPTSGLFYAVDTDNDAYRVDVATGATTYIGTIATDEGREAYSLQIDTSGAWWLNIWTGDEPAETWYGPQPTGEATVEYEFVGDFVNAADPEDGPYTEALLLTYAATPAAVDPPKLAATGADTSDLVLGVTGSGLLLLAGGAVVLARRRATN